MAPTAPINLHEKYTSDLVTLVTREILPRQTGGGESELPIIVPILLAIIAAILLLGGFKLYIDSKKSDKVLAG